MPHRAQALPTFASDAARFRALVARDRRADSSFVYGVVTTGVFCRPSCASRRPLRENVRFFLASEAALTAGFRACLRCRPLETSEPSKLLRKACRLLEGPPRPESREVARRMGMSVSYFQRWFKRELEVTPQAYARRVRLEHAKEVLSGAPSVLNASVEAGYSGASRFYASAGRELGMAARTARKGGLHETVRFALRPCPLGRVLVAWTAVGVCHVALADCDEDATSELNARFPHAERVKTSMPAWVDAIATRIGTASLPEVPVDIRGTVFQERVWTLLREVPAGQTRTYREMAHLLGVPSATRAVARACAQNNLAVVIPCHRVVRGDGGLAGFRWGLERKHALLRCEAEAP